MELDKDRVREMFWLFSQVLPLGEEDQEINKKIFGISVAGILPDLSKTIGHEATKHLELLDEYFQFLIEAIAYCRMESNKQPEVQCDSDQVLTDTKKAIEEFDKTAKPINL